MSTMTVVIPSEVQEEAKTRALGQMLSGWSHDDADGNEFVLSYEDVLDILRQPENESYVTDERILVWEAFEDNGGDHIANLIEDLYGSYIAMAESAIRVDRESVLSMIASSVSNPALDALPAKMAFQVLWASIRTKDDELG